MFHVTAAQAKYQPLQDVKYKDDSTTDIESYAEHVVLVRHYSWLSWTKTVMLVFSIILNVFLAFAYLQAPTTHVANGLVGLTRDVEVPITHDNRSLDDELWNDPRYDSFLGMIAITDDVVEKNNLLPAQRWPWDDSKSSYFLNGFHSLHCVQIIRTTLIELRDQKPLTWHFGHVTHCVHTMREDVLCHADDTPRYTGALNHEAGKKRIHSGIGAIRMCRNWDKLHEYVLEHSACYRVPLDRPSETVDRYKSCPDGSKPWERLEQ